MKARRKWWGNEKDLLIVNLEIQWVVSEIPNPLLWIMITIYSYECPRMMCPNSMHVKFEHIWTDLNLLFYLEVYVKLLIVSCMYLNIVNYFSQQGVTPYFPCDLFPSSWVIFVVTVVFTHDLVWHTYAWIFNPQITHLLNIREHSF